MSERPKGDNDPRRLRAERDALLKLCDAQKLYRSLRQSWAGLAGMVDP